ncbi:MAG: histidine phosphatase family protein [Xanthobacteraceae bacterium]|nr:histidine phosphatase family protein [Xanthobacteraceae bacterium]
MKTLFLVRHAAYPRLGEFLAGRTDQVILSAEGRDQCAGLARRLSTEQVVCIQSSPRARALQTAEPIARSAGLPIEPVADIDEIDAGEWTGRDFDELEHDSRWQAWNSERATSRIPGGESMMEVQQRVLRCIERARRTGARGAHVMVTHAEVIRAAMLHFLGLPLRAYSQIEIGPASVSAVLLGDCGIEVLCLNEMAGG